MTQEGFITQPTWETHAKREESGATRAQSIRCWESLYPTGWWRGNALTSELSLGSSLHPTMNYQIGDLQAQCCITKCMSSLWGTSKRDYLLVGGHQRSHSLSWRVGEVLLTPWTNNKFLQPAVKHQACPGGSEKTWAKTFLAYPTIRWK